MLIHLDATSSTPLYAQLVATLRRSISNGEVAVGEKLPAAGDLADSLDLNKNTVLRAYRRLRDDGLVELRRGRGATVTRAPASPGSDPGLEAALDALASAAQRTATPLSDVIAGLTIRGVR